MRNSGVSGIAFFSRQRWWLCPVSVFFFGTLVQIIHSAVASSAARWVGSFRQGLCQLGSWVLGMGALKFIGSIQLSQSVNSGGAVRLVSSALVLASGSVANVPSFSNLVLSNNKRLKGKHSVLVTDSQQVARPLGGRYAALELDTFNLGGPK